MRKVLIMPKQTARVDVFYASMQIYYHARLEGKEWVSNEDYKKEIQMLVPDLAMGAQDEAYLVKQSELTRYFGLVYRDFPGRKSQITNRGIRFYKAFLNNDKDVQKHIILESILNDSFGRNNSAIKSSNSDIDPPKLFLRALHDIGNINIKGFKYLLFITHDKNISYNDALTEWDGGSNTQREIPLHLSNKYADVKFTRFLSDFGITVFENGEYRLSEFTKSHYNSKIGKLSIYNKLPDVVLTIAPVEVLEDSKEQQSEIFTSFAYDTMSRAFIKVNNRVPQPVKTSSGIKYKTNTRIGKTAIQIADYKCTCNKEGHITFISKLGKPYMEAHHLIPMCAQKNFSVNLDRIENIVSLCPICHSAIHLGNETTRINLLTSLFLQRAEDLKKCGIDITVEELFSDYYK